MATNTGWTDEELAAAIAAYDGMLKQIASGKPLVKRAVYRRLATQFGRTEKAFEFRLQNISSIRESLGLPLVKGLWPQAHVGARIEARILALMKVNGAVGRKKPHAAYVLLLPSVRAWLINIARSRSTVTYLQTQAAFDLGIRNIIRVMGQIGRECQVLHEPILTALIVRNDGGVGKGLEGEFGVVNASQERELLYRYWTENEAAPMRSDVGEPIEVKAARFVSVEVRPAQAAFRRKVFIACGGRCAISGCDVIEVLDAAHLVGRSWKKGHNQGNDGLLLRKDLHALYDRGLLTLSPSARVVLDPEIKPYYKEFAGKVVKKVQSEPN